MSGWQSRALVVSTCHHHQGSLKRQAWKYLPSAEVCATSGGGGCSSACRGAGLQGAEAAGEERKEEEQSGGQVRGHRRDQGVGMGCIPLAFRLG